MPAQDAMHDITSRMLDPAKPASKRLSALWHEYEEGRTREAKFVKDLDRIEMALQAAEYERGAFARVRHAAVEHADGQLTRHSCRSAARWIAPLLRVLDTQDRAS